MLGISLNIAAFCNDLTVPIAGDIIGFILTILVLFIAAGGGIGGGGAIIPLYLLFLGQSPTILFSLPLVAPQHILNIINASLEGFWSSL